MFVSADPPMVLVCIITRVALAGDPAERRLRVNVLTDTMQEVSNTFAASTLTDDMFDVADWQAAVTVRRFWPGQLRRRVEEIHRAGSHFIFLGNVEEVVLSAGAPLLYGSRSYGTPSFFPRIDGLPTERRCGR